jgi:hypothetical protein
MALVVLRDGSAETPPGISRPIFECTVDRPAAPVKFIDGSIFPTVKIP